MDRKRSRRFGQNFLIDQSVLDELAEDIYCPPGTPIVEIGPGKGALTRRLLRKTPHITAVEIDSRLIGYLKGRPEFSQLRLITGDAAKCSLADILEFPADLNQKPVLVGNLPFNKAGPILRRFLPLLAQFQYMYIMVQYEVAKRLTAAPNSRDFAFLTVFTQTFARTELVRKIPPEAFRPRPKVISATVRLFPLSSPTTPLPGFFPFLKAAFSRKRKKIINSLERDYNKKRVIQALIKCGIPTDSRPEQISPEDFARLFTVLEQRNEKKA